MTDYPAARAAVTSALNSSKRSLGDIDLFELYAPCTITEIMVSEAIGLFDRGQCAAATREGRTSPGGDVMINTSGGCLGRGHPPSLSGLYGLYELWDAITRRGGRAASR